jgi:DNA-directed RNA polymerase subunit K/omega
MIHRAADSNGFEFVRVAALRTAQLVSGCRPRVPASHKSVLTAQLEVVAGKVRAEARMNGSAAPGSNSHEPPGSLVRVKQR